MKHTVTETINALPERLYPFLYPDRWYLWLASDGPLPHIEKAQQAGDNFFTVLASDGQTATYTTETTPDSLVCRLEHLENGPWPGMQQTNTIELIRIDQNATELTWECEWYRDINSWRDWLINFLAGEDVAEMMSISIWNLKLLAEDTNDDNDSLPLITESDDDQPDSYDGVE